MANYMYPQVLSQRNNQLYSVSIVLFLLLYWSSDSILLIFVFLLLPLRYLPIHTPLFSILINCAICTFLSSRNSSLSCWCASCNSFAYSVADVSCFLCIVIVILRLFLVGVPPFLWLLFVMYSDVRWWSVTTGERRAVCNQSREFVIVSDIPMYIYIYTMYCIRSLYCTRCYIDTIEYVWQLFCLGPVSQVVSTWGPWSVMTTKLHAVLLLKFNQTPARNYGDPKRLTKFGNAVCLA